ncbi:MULTISPECIES: nucleoside hydrolase [unclassified Duganella]|uniref:nucleoside hydrolase n=1 Tax=unclassified Duganella TaxID=2636909 RepID=UPI0008837C87|nr:MULTISPECIES: nucleoside hydrolase [unclassified Duganella]SDF51702.1 Inosine-uridine nucleoside N-ribohydrolase [Duganella sp. OV458]SDI75448.1 Inosine-uridine nucleoside N-ribohydrolase [Duganella sp. OV510]
MAYPLARPLRGLFTALALSCAVVAQAAPQKVIVDMDIGDDIDDAFALGLLLQSPEIEIVGITTAWGDTALRAQLLERMLRETGHSQIPVAQGVATSGNPQPFTQARYAQRGKLPAKVDAVDFLLDQIKRQPGQITLLALGPLTNIGAAIQRDAATFSKLKQVAMMGGSVRSGYRKSQYVPSRPADKEYNMVSDIAGAQKLFTSGVPIVMMPVDSTQIRLDEVERNALLGHGSPVTDALALLYHQWINAYQPWSSNMPSLFDVVPVVWLIDPAVCPTTPLRIVVDNDGYTREQLGKPNAQVCLASDQKRFFDIMMPRLLKD